MLAYIEANLGEPLDVITLARVAAFSPFHFQRQFTATFGLSVGRYVQMHRLRRAAFGLAFREDSVTDIGLASGYDASEAFSRAFRRELGVSPTAFRNDPDWDSWHAAFDQLQPMGEKTGMDYAQQLTIEDTNDIEVAVLSHRGDPKRIGDSVRRFIAWRRASGLPPSRSRTFNIFHTPPDVEPDDYRVDLCAEVPAADVAVDDSMRLSTIPGGRVAVVHHRGSDEEMAAAFLWLYQTWLPQSGEEIRDFPPYLERLSFYPDVPQSQAEWRVVLPLR
ncbi:MAG: AraC family transcriptional regulator [Lysobacteraceae bacterium]